MIRILKQGEIPDAEILARTLPQMAVADTVAEILAAVRAEGDAALHRFCAQFDGGAPESLRVTEAEMEEGLAAVEPELRDVLERAAENIRAFHRRQVRNSFLVNETPGVLVGQKVLPIERVGLCVPGGAAPLASTVLMDAIPAKLAGCRMLVMVTPAGADGKISPAVLTVARIAGVDQIFKLGGAQAIAALAYGTESVPRVDKIVGPGGAFVSEAKRQVYGQVSIDMIAGPSEILVVADAGSDARCVAADLLSQAEHDRMASAVLVTDSPALAKAVQREIETQLAALPRQDIARESIEKNGKIILTADIPAAIQIANALAPEHLELCVDAPFDYLDAVKNAGSVFLGRSCPEALGDYFAGVNHTLPTSGTVRFSSPLSVDDFVHKMQFTYYTEDALRAVSADVAAFARAEKLDGHARSILVRTEEGTR
ncbi:MAG: histidinol dehydrogenase [Oscillospiraceae bacterium]|nr:histidinol dehydrogenase [Oscillospiraceae bacterium]MCD7935019.1 histidinol dehydrogenase [Oscillospiraceae bacterium]